MTNLNLIREKIIPAANLLTLLDDIAAVLDDVAVLSKIAAKKTAGVLGDDLALNAEQVSGVKADRELPVVFAVAKGSLLNKLILVPSALLISYFAPWLVSYLLIAGGLYLCFEGIEKLLHKFMSSKQELEKEHQEKLAALADPTVNMADLEKTKIKGAIITDFVLSAEIIVIILGTVQNEPFPIQVAVLSLTSIAFTVGVYGLVAMIVKIDDLGLYLVRGAVTDVGRSAKQMVGNMLLRFAPILMKLLSIVGTAAMFLVGGGIIAHGIPALHHFVEYSIEVVSVFPNLNNLIGSLTGIMMNGFVGIVSGLLAFGLFVSLQKLFTLKKLT
jgi:predicted DNA repair protein MutK